MATRQIPVLKIGSSNLPGFIFFSYEFFSFFFFFLPTDKGNEQQCDFSTKNSTAVWFNLTLSSTLFYFSFKSNERSTSPSALVFCWFLVCSFFLFWPSTCGVSPLCEPQQDHSKYLPRRLTSPVPAIRGMMYRYCKNSIPGLYYIDLTYISPRYVLLPLSPSQPVIAHDNIICWGTLLNLFACFVYIFRTKHMHAASGLRPDCVRIVTLEHGALGICKSSVCT